MKTTHTIQDIEGLMYEYAEKIKNAETKAEKTALYKRLKSLEKHYNNCNEKNINGKKYPTRKVPKEISKKELLALIDSVESVDYQSDTYELGRKYYADKISKELDLSGVFVK